MSGDVREIPALSADMVLEACCSLQIATHLAQPKQDSDVFIMMQPFQEEEPGFMHILRLGNKK